MYLGKTINLEVAVREQSLIKSGLLSPLRDQGIIGKSPVNWNQIATPRCLFGDHNVQNLRLEPTLGGAAGVPHILSWVTFDNYLFEGNVAGFSESCSKVT